MLYGLYDTVDGVWMGDNSGPATFDDFLVARVAAQVCDVRLGQRPGRTVAKEYEPGPKHLRDTQKTRMDALEALTGLEEGRYI